MTANGFTVDSNALRKMADALEQQSHRLDGVLRALSEIHVDSDAFGHLPAAGTLQREYSAHARDEVRSLADARGLLQDTADGLIQNAAGYEHTEEHIAELHQSIQRGF